MSFEHVVNNSSINQDRLDIELRSALPNKITGLSWSNRDALVRVNFVADNPPQSELDLATTTINIHDPLNKTTAQTRFDTIFADVVLLEGTLATDLTLGDIKKILAVQWHKAGVLDRETGEVTHPNSWT